MLDGVGELACDERMKDMTERRRGGIVCGVSGGVVGRSVVIVAQWLKCGNKRHGNRGVA